LARSEEGPGTGSGGGRGPPGTRAPGEAQAGGDLEAAGCALEGGPGGGGHQPGHLLPLAETPQGRGP